jgi:trimeric autotransporter adhesin
LQENTTADNNTAVGYYALQANTTGTQNVAMGSYALDANTTGSYNVAIGYASIIKNTQLQQHSSWFLFTNANTTGTNTYSNWSLLL